MVINSYEHFGFSGVRKCQLSSLTAPPVSKSVTQVILFTLLRMTLLIKNKNNWHKLTKFVQYMTRTYGQNENYAAEV